MMLFLLPYSSFNIKRFSMKFDLFLDSYSSRSLYRLLHIEIPGQGPESVPAEKVKDIYFQQLRGQWEQVK